MKASITIEINSEGIQISSAEEGVLEPPEDLPREMHGFWLAQATALMSIENLCKLEAMRAATECSDLNNTRAGSGTEKLIMDCQRAMDEHHKRWPDQCGPRIDDEPADTGFNEMMQEFNSLPPGTIH